jgi:hypothetical protein
MKEEAPQKQTARAKISKRVLVTVDNQVLNSRDLEEGAIDPSSALSVGSSVVASEAPFDESFDDETSSHHPKDKAKQKPGQKTVPVLGPKALFTRRLICVLFVCVMVLVSVICFLLAQAASECDEMGGFPPIALAFLVVFALSLVGGVAYAYDILLQQQLIQTHRSAVQSRAIVSSLFPQQVHDQLFQEIANYNEMDSVGLKVPPTASTLDTHTLESDAQSVAKTISTKARLKSFLDDSGSTLEVGGPRPIANLYPQATVLFADLCGFTAVRETSCCPCCPCSIYRLIVLFLLLLPESSFVTDVVVIRTGTVSSVLPPRKPLHEL